MAPVEVQGKVNAEVANWCCVSRVLYLVPLAPCIDSRRGRVGGVGLIMGFGGVEMDVVEIEESASAFNEGD